MKEKSKTLEELNKKIPTRAKDLKSTETEVQAVSGNQEQSRHRLNLMRNEFQEKKSSQSQAKSQGAVVDALMGQKRNGNIPGIIGRLGDLGAIDKKYDVAVSTACSGLNTVLVDTAETGKACIEYLRR